MSKNLITAAVLASAATAQIGDLILASMLTEAQAQEVHGFAPCFNNVGANSLTVTGSTGNVLLSSCGPSLLLSNVTATEAFYRLGQGNTTTAVVGDYSIPGNTSIYLVFPNLAGNYYLAGITNGGTTTLRLSQGSNF